MVWRRGKAYPKDLRDQILATVGSVQVVAARLGVSTSYVRKRRQPRHCSGAVTPELLHPHISHRSTWHSPGDDPSRRAADQPFDPTDE